MFMLMIHLSEYNFSETETLTFAHCFPLHTNKLSLLRAMGLLPQKSSLYSFRTSGKTDTQKPVILILKNFSFIFRFPLLFLGIHDAS